MTNFDVLIIGNGSTGSALALELMSNDPTLSVAVAGQSDRYGSASAAAGAMLNCWGELIPGTFENEIFSKRFQITSEAMDMWPRYVSQIFEYSGIDVPITWGTIVITSPSGPIHEIDNFDYLKSKLIEKNQKHKAVDVKDLNFLSPDFDKVPSNAIQISDGFLDSQILLRALEQSMLKVGVSLLNTNVISMSQVQSSWNVILEDNEILSVHKIVLANGAYARGLLESTKELHNRTIPLFFGAGTALEVKLPSWTEHPLPLVELNNVVRTMDRGGACGLHLVPLGNKKYYFGASNGVWEFPEENHRMHAVSWLTNAIEREFHHNFFSAEVKLRGPGFRPVSLDGFPILGQIDDSGIYMLNGTKRDGLTCSPYYAKSLAREIIANESDSLFSDFNPTRKALSYFDINTAIDSAAKSELGGEIMHGLRIPPYRNNDYINLKIEKIKQVYQKRNISSFGIHPELFHLYEYDSTFDKYVKPFI